MVLTKRCVVIPMPYKADKVSLRTREKKEAAKVHVPPPENATRMIEIWFTVEAAHQGWLAAGCIGWT